MITQSGVHIQKQGGETGTPTAEDIAVHMGRICRYGGAVWYTLLPHSIFVGLMAYRRSGDVQNLVWGLLHDAHEVVTSDVPRPFKCQCMKDEQTFIDQRIYEKFCLHETFPTPINMALIKQCDKDALHIEAAELRLPGFAEIELKYAKDYLNETEIYNGDEDRYLFQRIKNSVFHKNTIYGMESAGVRMFAEVLREAEKGNYRLAKRIVDGWGLLDG